MKKIYHSLLFVTILSFCTITYFAIKNTNSFIESELSTNTSTSTPSLPVETKPTTKEYITRTGKTITVEDSHPIGESLSTITITAKEFTTSSSSVIYEGNRLMNVFTEDLDKDGYDELYLITQTAGSGSYATIAAFASDKDEALTQILVPDISEEDLAVGGVFEGYTGHDSIKVVDGVLTRKFLVGGLTKEVTYTLEHNSKGYILFMNKPLPKIAASTSTLPISTSTQATTTKKTSPER